MKQLPLLPHYFKWIAFTIIGLSVVLSFSLKDLLWNYKETADTISVNIINLGLLMYFFSKRKEDDEMLALFRLKVLAGGFLFLITSIFVESIWNVFEPGSFNNKVAYQLLKVIIFVNVFYEINYQKRKKELNAE